MEYGTNFLKPSEMWKDIKPRIGKMLVAVNDIETRAENAQVEAYKRGYDDAKHECQDCQKIMTDAEQERVDKAYQQGLEDARNRRATCEFCEYAGNDESNEPCVRCCCGYMNMFRPKKKEEIQIGDEVKFYNGEKCVVTAIENGQVLEVIDKHGFSMKMDDGLRNSMNKTDRHFHELVELLQNMRKNGD